MGEEARERVDRYRALNNAVFGLALGLGAFSLSGFPIHGLEDIVIALALFASTFTIILGIWHDVHRMLKYPFGMSFAFILGCDCAFFASASGGGRGGNGDCSYFVSAECDEFVAGVGGYVSQLCHI